MAKQQYPIAVLGLGKTGFSVACFLAARGADFVVMDTRSQPPYLQQLQRELPQVEVVLGEFEAARLATCERLIVSPGIALSHPALLAARAAQVEISGDLDLFYDQARAPIVAITGSNAKSTVTTLVGLMARHAGIKAGMGGNLGTPMLELLRQAPHDLYVLELSSFQLETAARLRANVATVLNISADHLDRYPSFDAYRDAKNRIFQGCKKIVDNLDDPLRPRLQNAEVEVIGYRIGEPGQGEFGIIKEQGKEYLSHGRTKLMPAADVRIKGRHNLINALAALALGHAAGLEFAPMCQALREFPGLPHRCQWIANHRGVDYINDSKGTNPGATVAAVNGIGETGRKIVLIAGGEGKGANFDILREPLKRHVKALILLGRDALRIDEALREESMDYSIFHVTAMDEAVRLASAQADSGDTVLLSPACASLDMYANFEARGDDFANQVRGLG